MSQEFDLSPVVDTGCDVRPRGPDRLDRTSADELLAEARARYGEIADDNGFRQPPLRVRCLEIAVASVVLVVCAPWMVLLAWYIRWGTPGPALFRQTRVGMGFRGFTFYKYRTLYADASQRFPELYEYRYSPDELANLKFKVPNDPRVTPQGGWLRKTTFDELPNFWSVLTGQMALVGPRPEIPEMLPYYEGQMLKKFAVRPGITGLAQISGRGNLTFHETVQHDVEYVERRSLKLDLWILWRTLWKCLTGEGAY